MCKMPRLAAPITQRCQLVPSRCKPVLGQGRHEHCLGKAFGVLFAFAHQTQSAGVIGAGPRRRRNQIAISLVDQHQISNFHNTALHTLQLVPTGRRQKQDKQIRNLRHHGFRLPDANSFDQHNVKPCRLTQADRLAGPSRNAAKMGLAGRGPDKRIRITRQQIHAGLIAQN